jgi:hypothetical protein
MQNSGIATTEKLTAKKNFNLLRYVYGQLFLNALETTKSSIIIESWKARSWNNILRWLQDNKYISCLSIEQYDNQHRRINYIFNTSNVMYPQYLRYLQRLTNSRTIKITA